MRTPNPKGLVVLGALSVVALAGPMLADSAEAPAVAAAAAQLLPPGSLVQEVELESGGFVRATAVAIEENGLWLSWGSGTRRLPGLRPAGSVRTRRLWLGSDHQGRDLLARTMTGARTSLLVAVLATAIALSIGAAAGLSSALVARRSAGALRVGVDALLSLPRILVLLLLGVSLRGSITGVAAAIGFASWMEVSRLVEAETRRIDALAFVSAARSSGVSPLRLAGRHVLPNLLPVLAVAAPLVATEAILLESTLSFLGVAGEAGTTSWGRMVADGQRLLPSGWWIAFFPGVLLCLTAISVHGLSGAAREPMGGRRRTTFPADRPTA